MGEVVLIRLLRILLVAVVVIVVVVVVLTLAVAFGGDSRSCRSVFDCIGLVCTLLNVLGWAGGG